MWSFVVQYDDFVITGDGSPYTLCDQFLVCTLEMVDMEYNGPVQVGMGRVAVKKCKILETFLQCLN